MFRLVVEDNGIGFDENYLDRIFTVFQRLHSRVEYEGTGIGLAVCRKIAQRHGGDITATSTVSQGARFRSRASISPREREYRSNSGCRNRYAFREGKRGKRPHFKLDFGRRNFVNAYSNAIVILLADDDEDDRLLTADALLASKLANDFNTVGTAKS